MTSAILSCKRNIKHHHSFIPSMGYYGISSNGIGADVERTHATSQAFAPAEWQEMGTEFL